MGASQGCSKAQSWLGAAVAVVSLVCGNELCEDGIVKATGVAVFLLLDCVRILRL
jgi:hypothetical protein